MRGQLGEEAPDQGLIVLAHHVVAVEQIVRGIAEQVEHQPRDGVQRPAPLLEPEGGFQHAALLVITPGLQAMAFDEFQVAEQGGDDVVHMGKPEGREAEADAEVLEVGAADAASGGELVDPASRLEQGEQAAFPFVADEVAQEGEGLLVVEGIHARQREGQRQFAGLLDRGYLDADAEIIEPVEGGREGGGPQAAIRNGAEEALTPGQLGLNGCRREHHQRHAIRTVVGFVERNEVGAQIPTGQIRQGIQVADRELGEGVGRVDRLLVHLIAAAHIVLQLEAVFGVDRVALLVDPLGGEGGADEELGEAIQPRFEEAVVDVEEEVGELGAGPGVVAAPMATHELLVLAGFGISTSTEEQHMLKEMGHALAIDRVIEVAGVDGQGGGRFIGLGIADQQDPEPVCQLQIVIPPMVVGTGIWAHWGVTRGEFI